MHGDVQRVRKQAGFALPACRYTELTQASTSRASLVTELPGAFLEAQPVNATAVSECYSACCIVGIGRAAGRLPGGAARECDSGEC